MEFIRFNVLVLDAINSRFVLIAQLLFFLLYSLLLWGWFYWCLERVTRDGGASFSRLDLDGRQLRPTDCFDASFSSVFSISISAIKGTSSLARIRILAHGFLIGEMIG
jgi:hypothetical protein